MPSGDVYDFHRSLRLRAARLMNGRSSPEEVLDSVSQITALPERRSAKAGLERLIEWREANPGEAIDYPSVTYESPADQFRVLFTPGFGIRQRGVGRAIHIWNTAKPTLIPRFVYAAMSLFPTLYRVQGNAPDDLAVLSLPDDKMYMLSDAPDHGALGLALIREIEALFVEVRGEMGLPGEPPEDRPPTPPPA